MGILGALLASFSVILLPFLIMILVSRFLQKHQNDKIIACMLTILRLTIVGLIAAAALLLATPENFGTPGSSLFQFVCSILIFIIVFVASFKFKISPILLILSSGILGAILYL